MIAGKISEIVLLRDASLMISRQEAAVGRKINNEEPYGIDSYNGYSEKDHPLFKKNIFSLKILASVCLFLIVAVMFKHPSVRLDPARSFVTENMNKEFQFASISNWYESAFGKPIAFLPNDADTEPVDSNEEYAMPASAKITQTFETNGEGIILETSKGSKVEAVNEGVVIFAGERRGLERLSSFSMPIKVNLGMGSWKELM
ncbi:hypothetical protein RCO48_26045 [Peribacillus frigoritolerans]|nr:hypothetical protein [Peribacillus frigoritolerans]